MRFRFVVLLSAFALLASGATAFAAGGGWRIVSSPGGPAAQLAASSFFAPNDGWTVGSTGASLHGTGLDTLTERWDGTRWQVVGSPAFGQSDEAFTGVTSTGQDNAWAVGWHDPYGTIRVHGLMAHWDGTDWTVVQDEPGSPIPTAVDARTPSDVWAVGSNLFEHFDGTSWSRVHSPRNDAHLRAVVTLSAHDAWAAGGRDDTRPGYHHDIPYLAHWNGNSWSSVAVPSTGEGTVNSISAVSPTDIWAVGTLGSQSATPLALHYDGTSWQRVPMAKHGDWTRMSGVVAVSSNDVWAVGDRNGHLADGFAVLRTVTEHWDGLSWSSVPSPSDSDSDNFLTSAAESGGTVWAFGADGGTLIERR